MLTFGRFIFKLLLVSSLHPADEATAAAAEKGTHEYYQKDHFDIEMEARAGFRNVDDDSGGVDGGSLCLLDGYSFCLFFCLLDFEL